MRASRRLRLIERRLALRPRKWGYGMRKSLDADVSEHWVKPVKISLLEQAIEAAFNLDRIKASPKATQGEHCLQCTGLADPTYGPAL